MRTAGAYNKKTIHMLKQVLPELARYSDFVVECIWIRWGGPFFPYWEGMSDRDMAEFKDWLWEEEAS